MSAGERRPGREGRRKTKPRARTDEAESGEARHETHARTRTGKPPHGRSEAPEPPPATVEEALARALRHGRNALAETLLAGRALLDAASLAVSGRPAAAEGGPAPASEAGRALAGIARVIDGLAERLRADEPDASLQLVQALLEALDVEIGRWEERARQDADARAVLRAFLGLRELLWELGMRPRSESATAEEAETRTRTQPRTRRKTATRARSDAPEARPRPPSDAAGAKRRRVQRVEIER